LRIPKKYIDDLNDEIKAKVEVVQKKSTIVMCDNSSTIKLSKNPVMHGRSKHTVANRNGFLTETVKERLLISYNYALYLHSTCQSFP
jgi:hypothetical protein